MNQSIRPFGFLWEVSCDLCFWVRHTFSHSTAQRLAADHDYRKHCGCN